MHLNQIENRKDIRSSSWYGIPHKHVLNITQRIHLLNYFLPYMFGNQLPRVESKRFENKIDLTASPIFFFQPAVL